MALAFGLVLWCGRAAVSLGVEPPPTPVQEASRPNLSLRNEVQRAIDKGVTWLEKQQDPKGFWSTPDHPALTALALLALHGEPTGTRRGSENHALRVAYDYLLSR